MYISGYVVVQVEIRSKTSRLCGLENGELFGVAIRNELPKAPIKRSQLFMQQRATIVVKKKFVPFDHLVVCCCIMLHEVCSRSKMFVEQMLCDRTFLLFSAMLHVVAFV